MCGKTPSSSPVRKTTGNSSPFAVCSVISVTTPVSSPSWSGIWSESATSATRSRNSGTPGAAGVRSAGSADGGGDRLVGELAGHRDELGEVLDPGLVLRVVAGLELGEVAAAGQGLLEHHVGPLPRGDHRHQLLGHVDERRIIVTERVAMPGASSARRSASQKVDAVAPGQRLDARLGPLADPPLGDVEDPAQADLVGRVGQHPQVGQRVADLACARRTAPRRRPCRACRPG